MNQNQVNYDLLNEMIIAVEVSFPDVSVHVTIIS